MIGIGILNCAELTPGISAFDGVDSVWSERLLASSTPSIFSNGEMNGLGWSSRYEILSINNIEKKDTFTK